MDATTALAVHQRELEAVQEDAVAVLATHQQELQAAREHAATALAAHQRELRTARDDEAARAADLEAVRARADALELSHADLRQALSDAETSVDAARRDRDAAIAQLDAVRQSAGEDQANETARYDDLREKTERRILDLELELIRGNLTPVEDDIELAVDPEMAAGPITKAAPSKLQPSPALHSPPRGAERQAFREALGVQLDGEAALIVDLSTSGAQVLSQTALKPARMIKMLLPSAESPVLCKGKIVWARLEPPSPGKTYRYRAGVFFTAIDASALQTFMTRHGGGSARES